MRGRTSGSRVSGRLTHGNESCRLCTFNSLPASRTQWSGVSPVLGLGSRATDLSPLALRLLSASIFEGWLQVFGTCRVTRWRFQAKQILSYACTGTHGYAYTRLRARERMGMTIMNVCTHSWVRGCIYIYIYIYVWRSLLAPNSYVDVVRRDRMPQSEYLLCTYVAVEVLT